MYYAIAFTAIAYMHYVSGPSRALALATLTLNCHSLHALRIWSFEGLGLGHLDLERTPLRGPGLLQLIRSPVWVGDCDAQTRPHLPRGVMLCYVVMCYVLCVMCYVLCVMCYVLCVMCYVLCVMCCVLPAAWCHVMCSVMCDV